MAAIRVVANVCDPTGPVRVEVRREEIYARLRGCFPSQYLGAITASSAAPRRPRHYRWHAACCGAEANPPAPGGRGRYWRGRPVPLQPTKSMSFGRGYVMFLPRAPASAQDHSRPAGGPAHRGPVRRGTCRVDELLRATTRRRANARSDFLRRSGKKSFSTKSETAAVCRNRPANCCGRWRRRRACGKPSTSVVP